MRTGEDKVCIKDLCWYVRTVWIPGAPAMESVVNRLGVVGALQLVSEPTLAVIHCVCRLVRLTWGTCGMPATGAHIRVPKGNVPAGPTVTSVPLRGGVCNSPGSIGMIDYSWDR